LSDWFLFLTLTFASYRVTQLLVYDDGPFNLILKFRTRIGVYDLNQAGEPKANLGRLFACPYCVGFWISFLTALVGYIYSGGLFVWWLDLTIWWLGIAGAQAFLESRGYASSR
jgi:hypothetical protein